MPARSPIRVVVAGRRQLRRTADDGLAAAGIEVAAHCETTAELLAAVSRERPDACVLDRDLSGGAFAALAALASSRRPKVLVVGGRGSPAEVRAARLAGAADCLPGDTDALSIAASVAALVHKERS